MTDYKRLFDDELEDESYCDGELLSIAREFIEILQSKILEVTGKQKIEEVE